MDQDTVLPVPGQSRSTTPGPDPNPEQADASPDELAKIRLWHLLAQSQLIVRQTIFADTKAATLLALIGLIATRVAIDLTPEQIVPLVVLVFVNKAMVLSLCLAVIMPRLPSREKWAELSRDEKFSWTALSNPYVEPVDYGTFGAHAGSAQICTSIARSNQDAAGVLRTKFQLLRWAFVLAIVDVVMTIFVFLGGTI